MLSSTEYCYANAIYFPCYCYLIFLFHIFASDVETDGVYLWELEHLGKYFPSEGKGIENIMSALSVAGKKDSHGDSRARYNVLVGDQECILANIRRKPGKSEPTVAYIRAGPRSVLHFNPATVNAAIVTCGGLCPGLNNVVREITRALYHLYGIKGNVYGIVGGFKGFYDQKVCLLAYDIAFEGCLITLACIESNLTYFELCTDTSHSPYS